MHPVIDNLDFGKVGSYTSVAEVAQSLKRTHGDAQRSAAAAYGMALAAVGAMTGGKYRDDALEVLNVLVRAKAEIDIAALHLRPVVHVTSCILLAAQCFADEATIPCTEWPTQEEIAEVVCRQAQKYALSAQ
ncbi:hypothetical protein [Candidatus Chloroploca asiatica]|uniref:Uncharacterized protein n=1 Tax=Candidatus Chloroploca asiatica TaxID=1506545 RepID=A0A2H3KLM1_9CHLR|nr:hypothetical protein [Candidatus Chloroploca asiatica]PDV98973.1 hypothetical protein A9Q02_14070 [Candidatus Chloroploca asiatica]